MDKKIKSRIALSLSAAALGILSALALVEHESVEVPEPAPVVEVSEPECSGRLDARLGCIPSYCDRFPAFCKACDVPPCGEPIGLVCCEEPIGCFGVFAYSDCEGDIYSCEWGYQGRNDDGTAYVICFD